jgi:toxin ParE1/3/4
MSVVWTLRLTTQAELDFSEILAWTAENFGEIQTDTYAETLTLAIEALQDGPELLGARARDDIQPGIRTLHVARRGRNGRHFVVFRQTQDQYIDVLRLLHDSMDLARHIPARHDQSK